MRSGRSRMDAKVPSKWCGSRGEGSPGGWGGRGSGGLCCRPHTVVSLGRSIDTRVSMGAVLVCCSHPTVSVTPLQSLAHKGYPLSYLLSSCSQGFSGLHMVCKEWHCDCLKFLLDHCHVEVDLRTSSEAGGETPLHLAVPRRATPTTEQRCVQVMKTLLDHGANPNL